jgi:hypothetical protein
MMNRRSILKGISAAAAFIALPFAPKAIAKPSLYLPIGTPIITEDGRLLATTACDILYGSMRSVNQFIFNGPTPSPMSAVSTEFLKASSEAHAKYMA